MAGRRQVAGQSRVASAGRPDPVEPHADKVLPPMPIYAYTSIREWLLAVEFSHRAYHVLDEMPHQSAHILFFIFNPLRCMGRRSAPRCGRQTQHRWPANTHFSLPLERIRRQAVNLIALKQLPRTSNEANAWHLCISSPIYMDDTRAILEIRTTEDSVT